MQMTMSQAKLAEYVSRQINSFFPDRDVSSADLMPYVHSALERLEHCLSGIRDKYLPQNGETFFSHRHTDHYAMFLYLLAREAWLKGQNREIAEKAFGLNKALHALDVFFEVELPEIFFFQHPVGTVLGRARYSNYFIVYQRCTVGGKNRVYPKFSEEVVMFGGSSVIGNCTIGCNVWLSAGALVMSQDVPDNSAVFGQSPAVVIKPTTRRVRDEFARG